MSPRQFGPCQFDPSDGRLTGPTSDQAQTLRPQLGRLLEAFIEQPGEVLDREHLCRAVWDESAVVDFESGLAALLRELRQALDKVGAGSDLIETVPRRGYRLRVDPEPTPVAAGSAGRGPSRRAAWGMVAVALVVVLAVSLLLLNGSESGSLPGASPTVSSTSLPVEPPGGDPSLAIVPFEVYGPSDQSESDARRLQLLMADSLLARLWQAELPGLVLIGRTAIRPYETRQDLAVAVAEDLGVDLLLEGGLVFDRDDGWRIDARLLRMPQGNVLWSGQADWVGGPNRSLAEPAENLVSQLVLAWPALHPVETAWSER